MRIDRSQFALAVLGLLLGVSPSPLASRDAFAQELLQNGGFEAGAPPWVGCGGVDVVDRQDAATTPAMVRTGRYAGRIGGLSDGSCGSFPFSQFVIAQPIVIPADASDLTLSFWFSRLGPDIPPDGNYVADLSVELSTDPSFAGALFDVVSHNVLRGWMPFRGHLRADDLAALRGETAYLRFAVQSTGDYPITYVFDDVSLVAGDVHTEAEPLPDALAGDGSRPLVLLQQNPANPDGLTVVRLDTDGSKPLAIDTGRYHEPRIPRWSPDGSAVAVVDDDVVPHTGNVPAILKARITRLSVVLPGGGGRREVVATTGLEGTSGSPPFCQPPNCVDLPRPALDQIIKGVEWSPDGRRFAVTICTRTRYFWGESDDDLCRVTIVDATSGAVIRDDLDGWFRADWSATGGVLFNGPARFSNYQVRGVWEGDPTVTPPGENLILPAPEDLLVGGDRLPTWAPDGRHFVTAREIDGYRFGANGFAIRNEAVILHDRDDLENPRVLLIVDQGGISDAIDDFTWSPDGRYVLYALYESTDAANVWWLDVATGATGRVTNDGASVSVDWRQHAGDEPGPPPTPGPEHQESTCDAAKLACVAKRQACLLKVHATAEKSGSALDAAALQQCAAGADACVAKAESKQNPGKQKTLCSTVAQGSALGAIVDAFVTDVVTAIDPQFPSVGVASTCDAGKAICVAQRAACLFGARAAAEKKGAAPDPTKIQKCVDRFDGGTKGFAKGCLGKLESKQSAAKSKTLCAVTGGAAALEDAVDAFVDGAVEAILNGPVG